MHDLVMAERKDVSLAIGVQHVERKLTVVVPPVYGLPMGVRQRVVHPTHIPLMTESESTSVSWMGDARPCG